VAFVDDALLTLRRKRSGPPVLIVGTEVVAARVGERTGVGCAKSDAAFSFQPNRTSEFRIDIFQRQTRSRCVASFLVIGEAMHSHPGVQQPPHATAGCPVAPAHGPKSAVHAGCSARGVLRGVGAAEDTSAAARRKTARIVREMREAHEDVEMYRAGV
jgi:hypothetical protein